MGFLDRFGLPEGEPGPQIHRLDLIATLIFVVFAVAAAALPGPLRIAFAVYSTVLFAIGVLAFLGAYGKAIGRSRTDKLSIPGIFGLSGTAAKSVQRRFHLLTVVQTVVAVATSAIHPFTAQAFGILVPMLGLGLAGWWGASHGDFPPRDDPRRKAREQLKESLDE